MKTPPYLFIDTMIFLHFAPLDQIEWVDFVDNDHIEILITSGVIRELDKHKNIHSSEKIRERARRVLKQIESWAISPDGIEIRPKVIARIYTQIPTIDFSVHSLDPAWPDDILIASAISTKAGSPERTIHLVSDDTGARIKARNLGILPIVLPDKYRLPIERDPLEIENEQLKKELVKLSTPTLPHLAVEFSNEKTFIKFPLPNIRASDQLEKEAKKTIDELKAKFKPYTKEDVRNQPLKNLLGGVSDQEIDRYNGELSKYFDSYEDYIQQYYIYNAKQLLKYKFTLQLSNTGRAPAEDVDIHIHFPDGFSLTEKENIKDKPKPPNPPKPPMTEQQLFLQQFEKSLSYPGLSSLTRGLIAQNLDHLGPPPNVSEAKIKKSRSYEVSYTVQKLKHGYSVKLGSLIIAFDDAADIKSFEANYIVNAANMPVSTSDKLRFAFNGNRRDT
jgi:hypothetical protein